MSKTPNPISDTEFPYPIGVDKIPAQGMVLSLEANEKQRKALAERFGLLELTQLNAQLKINQQSIGSYGFLVSGTLEADALQQCVVSLEPLPVHIKTDINVTYIENEEGQNPENREIDLIHDADDVEFIHNGYIDVGELVAQHFGVSLDPYPRKPGLTPVNAGYGEEETTPNPFAQLVELKKKPKDKD